MFKYFAPLLLLLSQVGAFAPVARGSRSMSMKVDLVGSSAPLGFFDPLGFSKGASEETMKKYRESELKHGRVAMLAVFGVLTAEKFHPLYDGKLSSNPLEAFMQTPPLAFVQIVVFCGIVEYVLQNAAKQPGYTPGNYYGVQVADSEGALDSNWVSFQTRELNNGRLAMFAILGELAHAGLTGKGPLELMGL